MDFFLSFSERLKDLRVKKGLTLKELSEEVGLSVSTLSKYENCTPSEITVDGIMRLAKFYNVSIEYLFSFSENKNHSNTDYSDLHLSDELIAFLKDEKKQWNHRLFCEIVQHENFLRFLIDAEIYVDRIADGTIHDLNLALEAHRYEIEKRSKEDENKLYLRTLELAKPQVTEYFSYVVYEDIFSILRDIREAHKTDVTTADEQTEGQKAVEAIHSAYDEYEKTKDKDASIAAAAKQAGLNLGKLTQDERRQFIELLKKALSGRAFNGNQHRMRRKHKETLI